MAEGERVGGAGDGGRRVSAGVVVALIAIWMLGVAALCIMQRASLDRTGPDTRYSNATLTIFVLVWPLWLWIILALRRGRAIISDELRAMGGRP